MTAALIGGLGCLSLVPESSGGELCALGSSCAGRATVLEVAASGSDLVVDLMTESAPGPLELRVEGRNGTFYGATTFFATNAAGAVTVTVPGVLAGGEQRDIFYRLRLRDGVQMEMMTPFPWALFFTCQGPGCTYRVLEGVETEALLVTDELRHALDLLPPCQMESNLLTLLGSRPDLADSIETLLHQMNRAGLRGKGPALGGCVHAWTATVDHARTMTYEADTAVDTLLAEAEGFGLGGGLCHSYQGTRLAPGAASWETDAMGSTRLELEIECVDGPPQCAGGCSGTTDLTLSSCVCAATTAESCDPSMVAEASAAYQLGFLVNGASELTRDLEASALAPPVLFDESLEIKVDVTHVDAAQPLDALVQSKVGFGYSLPAAPASGGAAGAYVFGETNGVFELAVEGFSICTANGADTLIRTHGDSRSGGLKLRSWYPPDDDGYGVLGALGPEPPLICAPVTTPWVPAARRR